MISMFGKVKAVCALVVMGLGLAAYSAAPTVTSVTAQQRYPWNGLVDIVVTFNGAESDVAKANCTFAATNSATKTALTIAHVTPQGSDTGSGTTWTRRFIWDTNADLGEVKIEDVELVVDVDTSGVVQLWEGGPYWATCNVGASKPEEYGLYFWWGDTVGHAGDWYFDPNHCPTYGKNESELRSLGYIDSSGNLAPAHDAARAHLGAPWRMPTSAEFDALVDNCDTIWTTRNGVNGRLVIGRGSYSSKSVFLPAAAYGEDSVVNFTGGYWSSTPDSDYSIYAWGFYFYQYDAFRNRGRRYWGQPVRSVRGIAGSVHSVCSTHLSLDNRTGTRVAAATEQIRFSPAWETDAAGAMAVVSTNGVAVSAAIEAGVYEWTSTQDGTYELTHAVYANGVQVGETLTATFVAGGIVPRGCDWAKGTIELGWFADAQDLNPITYSIYWSENADPASCVGNTDRLVGTRVFAPSKIGVQELTISDDQYLTHGDGLKPIYYHIVGTDGYTASSPRMRNRHGLFVGVGEFGGAYGDNKPTPVPSCPKSAEKFCKLMKEQGRLTDETSRLLTDGLATYENVDKAFSNFAKVVKPGDVCVVYFSTHGGLYPNSTTGYLCLYDKPPRDVDPKGLGYNENLLAHHIRMLDRDEKGVAVVNVISACHSGALFNDSSEAMICRAATYWCQKEHLNPANIAWITAADYNTIAMTYFDNFLLDYGWEGGWADTKKEGVISFLDLANYTKLQYDKLFKFKSNIFFKDEDDSRKVQIVDEHNILGKIIAGKCKVHADADPPSSPSVSASQGTFSDKIELKGDNSSDAWYCIFYRFGERMYWAGLKSVGKFPFDFNVLLGGQKYSGEYDDFLSTTSSSPAHFIVKAVNGAGISEESTEQRGWVNSQMKKVVFDGNEGMLPNKWDGVSPRGPKGAKWVLKGNALGNVPNPESREGFTFVGWFNGAAVATSATVIQEDVTYTARWRSFELDMWKADADAKARNMTILYREVVGTSSSAFELAIDDDCNVSATGEMADGSPIEVRSSIERIVDDEAEIPLTWTDKNGVKIGMVIRISKSGKVTIKDGGYTRDGVPVEIEVIPEFRLLIKDGVLTGYEGEMPVGYEMIVPDEVTEIGANAFRVCPNLKSVSLSVGLDRIEYGAFCECSGLLEINLPAGLTSIGEHAFSSSGLVDVSIPDSVTNVGANAFCICQDLREITLGENLLGLSENVFGSCFSLAKVNMGSQVKVIGGYSFFQDYGLTLFVIPNGVEEIGEYSFCSCVYLREVLIPKSVNSIGQGAFMSCGSLSTICVEEGDEDRVRGLLSDSGLDVTSIMFVHEGEFTLNISEDGCLEGCVGWLPDSYDLVIPEGVRQINWYALSGLPIRSVHIPKSCTWIGEGAFSGCENLVVVTGGDGLDYVATRAFEGTPFMEDGEDEPDVAYVGRCAVGLRRSWMLDEMYSESDPDKWTYELCFRDGTVCVSGFDWLPITSIVFPDSVETIASDAFSKCDLLREVSFGENLRGIEFGAFRTWDTPYDVWDTPEDTDRTPEIMELYFPAGLEYVGGDAFAGWDNLQTAYFEGRIGDWWTEGFPEGCELVSLTIQKLIVEDGIVKGLFDVVDKTGRESGDIVDGVLVLPDGVTAIDDFALSDAPIRTIVIPESCKRIGEYALAWCYDLEQVIGGNGVESVGYSAFEGSCLFDDWADEFGLVYVGKCLVGCRGRFVLQAEFDAFEGDDWRYDLIIKDGTTSVGGA